MQLRSQARGPEKGVEHLAPVLRESRFPLSQVPQRVDLCPEHGAFGNVGFAHGLQERVESGHRLGGRVFLYCHGLDGCLQLRDGRLCCRGLFCFFQPIVIAIRGGEAGGSRFFEQAGFQGRGHGCRSQEVGFRDLFDSVGHVLDKSADVRLTCGSLWERVELLASAAKGPHYSEPIAIVALLSQPVIEALSPCQRFLLQFLPDDLLERALDLVRGRRGRMRPRQRITEDVERQTGGGQRGRGSAAQILSLEAARQLREPLLILRLRLRVDVPRARDLRP